MSEPLDDFNRRTTAGSSSWTMGPPTNAAESAAQSLIDAQRPRALSAGGGSIDFGVRPGAIILLTGIALFVVGGYVAEQFREGTAMTGLLVVLVSGFLMLIGGGSLLVGCIRSLGSTRGWIRLFLAVLAGFMTWWLLPRLWMMGLTLLPRGLLALAAVALVFLVPVRRRGNLAV